MSGWVCWLRIVGAGAVVLAVAGCASGRPAAWERPSGQSLVAVASDGRIAGVGWRVEVVRQGSQLCTQPVAAERTVSTECGYSVSPARAVNFQVTGNADVLFVDGAADAAVTQLRLITADEPEGIPLRLVRVDGAAESYFGHAVVARQAKALVGYDATGRKVYNDAGKIRGARDEGHGLAPSGG
jgi:hypothetical protein